MKKDLTLPKRSSTILLRVAIIGLGLLVLLICLFMLPAIFNHWSEEFPSLAYARLPILTGLSITALAFFTALYQAMRLLGYIDKNKAFSTTSVSVLNRIKYAALVIAAVYVCGLPVIYSIAQSEDAPGLIIYFSAIFIGGPFTIAIFSDLVAKLLQNVIDIKSENDLTV